MSADDVDTTTLSNAFDVLTNDDLECIGLSLPITTIGAAQKVCHRWHDTLGSQAVWRCAAQPYIAGVRNDYAEKRAASHGGWKSFARHEHLLKTAWYSPDALQERALESGHQAWVPSILMDARSRELATCSYDGTIRFWSDADAEHPQCFKLLTGAMNEGFSCLSALSPADGAAGPVVLAAGSELGHVHVWEVWRPEDAPDARAAAAFAAAQRERACFRQGGGSNDDGGSHSHAFDGTLAGGFAPATHLPPSALLALEGLDLPLDSTTVAMAENHEAGAAADSSDDSGSEDMADSSAEGGGGSMSAQLLTTLYSNRSRAARTRRPHFARKLGCWHDAHDFVQSVLAMPGGLVATGGDAGYVRLDRLSSMLDEPDPPSSLAGHSEAVMCLASLPHSGTLFSASVDKTVAIWDLHAHGAPIGRLTGHARSVHCLALGREGSALGESVLFTGSRDHRIKVWDLRTPRKCMHTLHGHTGSVTCMGVDGWRLVSGGGYDRGADDEEVLSVDSSLRLWDVRRIGQPSVGDLAVDDEAPSSDGHQSAALVWTRETPSSRDPTTFDGDEDASMGNPMLSLQLHERKVLTSHGGVRWTARIWDLEIDL